MSSCKHHIEPVSSDNADLTTRAEPRAGFRKPSNWPVADALKSVARGKAPVGLSGAGISGRGAVAAEHLAGPPAGQPHQIGFAAALGEPGVRERVAELVRVQPRQACLCAAAAQKLLDAPASQPAALAKPEPGKMGVLVAGADAEVAVPRHGGLAAVGEGALAAGLA